MTASKTVGPPTHGGANISATSIATASFRVVDDATPTRTSVSVGAGGRVVLQVVPAAGTEANWTAGSVYLTADAGGGFMSPTGNACTFGRSGTGILDMIANYDCEVGAETSADFVGLVNILLKTAG